MPVTMLKVLFVSSGNSNVISPFILDQAEAIKHQGVDIDFFSIKGKGISGYLKNHYSLLTKIKVFKPDIIHAHYGLSGLLACLQYKAPIVITFHGGDVHLKQSNIILLLLSFLASCLSKINIFVNNKPSFLFKLKQHDIIPCGVDLKVFRLKDKGSTKKNFNLFEHKNYILFSSSFSNYIKNYPLAINSLKLLNNDDIQLIELSGLKREGVSNLINAVDICLMTSLSEGSPQFIKEAMACGCPIVSTDVGDVKMIFGETEGCFLSSFAPTDVAEKIRLALDFAEKKGRTKGRERIIELGLDSETIARKIINVYKKVLN